MERALPWAARSPRKRSWPFRMAILEGIPRPAHDLPAEEVKHHAQVQPALAGGDAGDVGARWCSVRSPRSPAPGGSGRGWGGRSRAGVASGAAAAHPAVRKMPSAGHPIAAVALAFKRQALVHPRHPEDATAFCVDPANARQQALVVPGSCTWRPPRPCVTAAARYLRAPSRTVRQNHETPPKRGVFSCATPRVRPVAAGPHRDGGRFVRAFEPSEIRRSATLPSPRNS